MRGVNLTCNVCFLTYIFVRIKTNTNVYIWYILLPLLPSHYVPLSITPCPFFSLSLLLPSNPFYLFVYQFSHILLTLAHQSLFHKTRLLATCTPSLTVHFLLLSLMNTFLLRLHSILVIDTTPLSGKLIIHQHDYDFNCYFNFFNNWSSIFQSPQAGSCLT